MNVHVPDDDEPVVHLGLHIYGATAADANTVMQIADAFSARALAGDGFLSDPSTAHRSQAGWAQYRDSILNDPGPGT